VKKPRVLFVSRGRISVPLPPWLARKWDALETVFELRSLNAGVGSGDPRFRILPEPSYAFFPLLPFEVARELRSFRPDVVVAADPYVGAGVLAGRALTRSRAKVIVESHGDPRTFTRAYGSPARRLLSPLSDLVARLAYRRTDATRAVSTFTSSVVEAARGAPPTACFVAYSDLSAFTEHPVVPVPETCAVVFVGSLEAYKNIDGLAAAWRHIAQELPDAHLYIVGAGSRQRVVDELVRDLPAQVTHDLHLLPADVATRIDASRVLTLPSYPEGLGRVVFEAFARARGVVATDGGGIPDMVTHERNGLLVPPYDTPALVAALRRVLTDHDLAVRLGTAARETYADWHQTPEGFARAYRDLVDRVVAGAR
jgi:glycosyltransferase involved in cell wall biosynthesis